MPPSEAHKLPGAGLIRGAALTLVGAALAVPAAPVGAATEESPQGSPNYQVQVIGHSLRGRPIRVWHLGESGRPVVLLIASMHGDEAAPAQILNTIRAGQAIMGVDLWVLPTYNPDGVAAHRRQNARGVDLNRNFPYRWADLDGPVESGSRPASEPETRAVMALLKRIRPDRIVSFHQPLFGVDTDTKDPVFARRLARALKLPEKTFDCGGVCHGTMTGWYNHNFPGSALTVEYGARPAPRALTGWVPGALLRAIGGRYARYRWGSGRG